MKTHFDRRAVVAADPVLVLGDSGVLRPGASRWARALGWMVAMLVVLILIVSLQSVVRAVLPQPSVVLAMAFICTSLAYLAYAGMVRWGERRAVSELALAPALPEIAIGVAIGGGAMATVMALLWLGGLYSFAWGNWSDWAHDIRETLGTGFLEELLARLVIFRLVARAFGIGPALTISAIAFGAAHLGNPHATLFSALAIAIEAGLMLAAFYVLTGRIWVSIGAHAGWNFAQGAIFGARVSGFDAEGSLFHAVPVTGMPNILSGGDFGPEGSAPAILVGLGLFCLTMAIRRRRLRAIEG